MQGNNKKPLPKSAQALATFEVEDDWEDEEAAPSLPAAMKQLKRKLKADKRPLKSDTKESLGDGEIEIVIPNKKYKGAEKMPKPTTPEVHQYNYHLSKDLIVIAYFFFFKNRNPERIKLSKGTVV